MRALVWLSHEIHVSSISGVWPRPCALVCAAVPFTCLLSALAVPGLRWVDPCCGSGSSAWDGSLVLGGCTPLLLHPGTSPAVSAQTRTKKSYQKVKESWFLPLTWFPRQAEAPVPEKWCFDGWSELCSNPMPEPANRAQYLLSQCCSTREELIIFSSGELQGPGNSGGKR